MTMKTISKSAFKPKAFEYLRLVEHGESLVITDRGKPVARVVPFDGGAGSARGALAGSITRYERPIDPVGAEDWET